MIDVIEITINEFKKKTMINILNYFQKMNKKNEKKSIREIPNTPFEFN